jgi:hypothetical protein
VKQWLVCGGGSGDGEEFPLLSKKQKKTSEASGADCCMCISDRRR